MRRLAAPLVAVLLLITWLMPAPATATGAWSRNLWAGYSWVYQDPYMTACTAASTMGMLNLTARRGSGGPAFRWTPYRVQHNAANATDYRDMTSILYFARTWDTLLSSSAGSDAHGWRNALNHYGWGPEVMRDPARRVYDDLPFATFDAAVKGAVRAIARYQMPVGILGWAGGHAQVMTGYEVVGENPALSENFTVTAIYLSDPLWRARLTNARITLEAFRSGPSAYRFLRYREIDSPHDDTLSPGWRRSSVSATVGPSEWFNMFVIVAPVRGFLPLPTPTPTPTPSPTPTPTPSPTPSPTPKPSASPTPTPTPKPSASPTPSPVATPTPTPTPSPTPSLSPAPPA